MPKRSELKLTKRAVDALSVEAKDAVFWDRDLAGFGVRVHAHGQEGLRGAVPWAVGAQARNAGPARRVVRR